MRFLESARGARFHLAERPGRDYHSVMKEVAEHEKIPLVDGASVLSKDPSVYLDFCHFNETGHRMIAATLKETIEPLLGGRQSPAARSP